MELKEGMYVRTNQGYIAKYLGEHTTYNMDGEYDSWYEFDDSIADYYENTIPIECITEKMFIKQSHNIIDLIEVGDILLLFDKEYEENYKAEVVLDSQNFKAISSYEQNDLLNLEYELITEEHIKLLQIATKEQFESMSYKVGGIDNE